MESKGLGVRRRGRAAGAGVGAGACAGRADGRGRGRTRRRTWCTRQADAGLRPAAAGARGARFLGALAGCGWALSALGLFSIRFDSVLFMSQFLDIVREPGS